MTKAEELMIGDYFFVAKDNLCIRKGTVVEIRGIDADDRLEAKNLIGNAHCRPLDKFQFEGGIWLDYLEPIPLTPEILEKNGFKYTDNHTLQGADTYILRYEQNGFDYTITYKLDDWFAVDSYDDRTYRIFEMETGRWCVHQIQHALKLCGIGKEIVI